MQFLFDWSSNPVWGGMHTLHSISLVLIQNFNTKLLSQTPFICTTRSLKILSNKSVYCVFTFIFATYAFHNFFLLISCSCTVNLLTVNFRSFCNHWTVTFACAFRLTQKFSLLFLWRRAQNALQSLQRK